MFAIGYGVLDAALRVIHDIRDDKAGLLARYKNFQRNGFPSGVNAGRGKAVMFGIDQILQLLLAFELVETGCGPTRIIRIVRTNWPELRPAFAQSWLVAAGQANNTRGRPQLVMAPSALAEMNTPDRPYLPVRSPFAVSNYGEIGEWLSDPRTQATRVVVDPAAIIRGFRDFLAQADENIAQAFDDGFRDWASDEVGVALGERRASPSI